MSSTGDSEGDFFQVLEVVVYYVDPRRELNLHAMSHFKLRTMQTNLHYAHNLTDTESVTRVVPLSC